MEEINLIIIGVGPHTQRIYLPTLSKYQEARKIDVKLGVDLNGKKADVKKYLAERNFDLEMLYIDPFDVQQELPKALEEHLTDFVKKHNVHGVVIATEPLVHTAYAKWALKIGLHILMDKPISTRLNVVSDINQARLMWQDYLDLWQKYVELQKSKDTIFSINVQRRYHPGHRKVISLIKEVANRFDAPVTSIQSMHADGQWRLPSEIVTQIYHPYCQGYGKCSHSGYHIFDIAYQYYKAGKRAGKYADTAEVMTSFVQPQGFLTQFNENNYKQYFGEEYKSVQKWSDEELAHIYKGYGEMDAFTLLRLLKDGENICNVSINLLHNSFARRHWMKPGKDLYKGNGRVKHQYHVIQQGSFQCVQIHNYQSSDRHDINTTDDYALGGNNHFDIHVFRNSAMFGESEKPLRTYKLNELNTGSVHTDENLTHETSKELVILEFIDFIQGKIRKKKLTSSIDDHLIPAQIMSAVYRSHIRSRKGESPLVRFPFKNTYASN